MRYISDADQKIIDQFEALEKDMMEKEAKFNQQYQLSPGDTETLLLLQEEINKAGKACEEFRIQHSDILLAQKLPVD